MASLTLVYPFFIILRYFMMTIIKSILSATDQSIRIQMVALVDCEQQEQEDDGADGCDQKCI